MKILCTGAGGALGGHLVRRLLEDGHQVRAVDIKPKSWWWQWHPEASNWPGEDMSLRHACLQAVEEVDQVYDLSANMGGIGWISEHHADAMLSVLISANLLAASVAEGVQRFWYASSACVYAADKQDSEARLLVEGDAWPWNPEAGYGEEKLFSEQLCRYMHQDENLEVRIARLHNVYGRHSTWKDGREKAPAAICRKVAEAKIQGHDWIEIWGDGTQQRSFLHVDDFVEGAIRIMNSDYAEPVNLGSEEVVTIDELVTLAEEAAGVKLRRIYDKTAPQGVKGRGSDNRLLKEVTGWEPTTSLRDGIRDLYGWVEGEVRGLDGLDR